MLPCATAAFTSTGKPDDFAVSCQLVVPYRPSMRFLFIGSQVSPSLPSPGWLPFPSWLQMVVSSFSCSGFPTGDFHPIYIAPMLGTHKALEPTTGPTPPCVRVRTRRFRSDAGQARVRCRPKPAPERPHASHRDGSRFHLASWRCR